MALTEEQYMKCFVLVHDIPTIFHNGKYRVNAHLNPGINVETLQEFLRQQNIL